MSIKAVLFDLDGTLADTAPDLVAALNQLRTEEGLEPLPLAQLRRFASEGARGLLREGIGIAQDHPDYPELAERFYLHYLQGLCIHTRLFHGMPHVLGEFSRIGLKWGVVTNKHGRFTYPLLEAMQLPDIACIVCGDTTSHPKPAPDPVLHACRLLGISPEESIYVGDDLRDIQAGKAAGSVTLAAAWGYLGGTTPISEWSADAIIENPAAILDWLD